MNILLLICALATLCALTQATPLDRTRWLINRPEQERQPRDLRLYHQLTPEGLRLTPEPNVRKGEYLCATGVCALRPGERPATCNGCQYPVKTKPEDIRSRVQV